MVIAIDTNIFIYFFEKNPEFGLKSKKIFELLATKRAQGTTSVITLIELLSFQRGQGETDKLKNLYSTIPNLMTIDVNRVIALESARIRRIYGFRTSDTIQLAAAIVSGATKFITNDHRLKKFKELKIQIL